MKICVYAICKNEEKFVDRWVASMKEADEIYVLDTGSTDNTVKKLKKLNVNVKTKKINPWRFDKARNESLKLVPNDTDICVCTDLDEIFEKGWRKELESIWSNNTNRCKYIYNWHINENKKPDVTFYYEKIHSRKNYKWIHPVHEILEYDLKNEQYVITDKIILNHYPDETKSRGSYLPLLELSVKEDPLNDRNMHYLGREYMYYQKYNEAIDTLIKHLNLESSVWKDERCASMRFIARCYQNLKRYDEARMWLDKAIKEAPYLRDSYVEYGMLEYNLNNYKEAEYYLKEALKIKEKSNSYINEVFSWNETPYDLLSIICFYQNKAIESLEYINKALDYDPNNERLKENKLLIENTLNRE